MDSWATQQCNPVPLSLCSLLAATSQFSVLISQIMQLTDWLNANNMRNVTCADTQTSNKWRYCSFLYCDYIKQIILRDFIKAKARVQYVQIFSHQMK